MLQHPECEGWSKISTHRRDLYVGWGAHSVYRQTSSLPWLLISSVSSVHVCSPTISLGHEDSLAGMQVEGSQGCLQSSSPSVGLSLLESFYYLSGCVAGWLLLLTGMATSDLLLRLLLLLEHCWMTYFLSSSAPDHLSLSGLRAVLAVVQGEHPPRPLGRRAVTKGRSATDSYCL